MLSSNQPLLNNKIDFLMLVKSKNTNTWASKVRLQPKLFPITHYHCPSPTLNTSYDFTQLTNFSATLFSKSFYLNKSSAFFITSFINFWSISLYLILCSGMISGGAYSSSESDIVIILFCYFIKYYYRLYYFI